MHKACTIKPVWCGMTCVRSRGDVWWCVATCVRWACNVSRQWEQGNRWIQQYQRSRTPWGFKGTLCNFIERCSQAEQLFELFFGVEHTLRRAATTSMRQELSLMISCDDDVVWTLRIWYETCLRCWSAYLGWIELPAAAGQDGLEGQIADINRWSKIANIAGGGKTISCKYQLS